MVTIGRMSEDAAKLLQKLIQIPSVNPMGHDVAGPTVGESRLTNFLQQLADDLGLPWIRQTVHPGRDNLLVRLGGNPPVEQGGELLLWDVHQDTVPTEGMTVDPFGGEIKEGRLYGRGACDVKGSMAAMVSAIARVAAEKSRPAGSPTIIIAFTGNEDCGFTGVEACCDLISPERRSAAPPIVGGTLTAEEMFPRLPDAAIVAEPTEFDVVVAHQGVVRWRCHTIGRAAHTSRPDAGINAIYGMTHLVQAIERHHVDLQAAGPLHPLCGRPTACVSTIHGGVAVNTVPERVSIEIDRRVGPNESPAAVYEDVLRLLTTAAVPPGCKIVNDVPSMQIRGLSDQNNGTLAKGLSSLAQSYGRRGDVVGVPYATDAAAIAALGIPTVVFGPGSIAQAHTADEYIDVAELELGAKMFEQIAKEGLKPILAI